MVLASASSACAAILGIEPGQLDRADTTDLPTGPVVLPDGAILTPDGAIFKAEGFDPDAAAACDPAHASPVDPRNCGRCGHDCQGSACIQGRCQPIAITNLPLSVGQAVVGPSHVYYVDTVPNLRTIM